MAIDLNELTLRLGRVGRALLSLAEYRATLGTDAQSLADEFAAAPALAAGVVQRVPDARAQAAGVVDALAACAGETVLTAVRADQSARSWTVEEAAAEVCRQFDLQGQTVPECGTSLAATALSPFAGDGLLVTTLRAGGGDLVAGKGLENVFGETLWLTCDADAQTGGATAGRERFRWRGGVAAADPWAHDWPAGSGADATVTAADPAAVPDEGGTQLRDGEFDEWSGTTPAPTRWTIQTGTAGTHIVRTTTDQYAGAAALSLPGSATLAALYQTLDGDAAGELLPLTRYAVAVRLKASAAPATGVLALELVDDSSTVVSDPQGVPLRLSIDLTALGTSYAARTGVWVTPRAVPASVRFRMRVTTAIETGRTVYLDALALVPMTEAYPGGPAAAVVAGKTPFARGDGWTVEVENDRAGASYGATWQALWDRLFGARLLGIQLPSSPTTPTYGDERITD